MYNDAKQKTSKSGTDYGTDFDVFLYVKIFN